MNALWTEKYFPKSFEGFIGNADIVRDVRNWSLEWNQKGIGKPLLLFGPSGVGKTALALLAARQNDWDLFELNASDVRNKDAIERLAGAASANASFSGKRRLVLLDEIDGLQKREDKGGMPAVLQVLKKSKNPVILTANGIYENRQMGEIRNFCKKMEFKKPNYLSVAKHLKTVCENEQIDFDVASVNLLAKNSSGDIRSALLDLQTITLETKKITLVDVQVLDARERQERIFGVLHKIFRAKSVSDAQKARLASDISPDFLFRWIEENIPLEFKDTTERANAFLQLSRADLFQGRIMRRQYWGFLRYSLVLMTAGVALAHQKPNHTFIMYKFPGLLRFLSAAASVRALKKNLGKKVGVKTHSSSKRFVSQDLPFWMQWFESSSHAICLAAAFELSADEIAFLMNARPSAKKVKEVFEKATALVQSERRDRQNEPLVLNGLQDENVNVPVAAINKDALDENDSFEQTTLF